MYRGNPHQGIAGFEPPGRRMPTMPHEVTHQAPGRISNDRMSGWINNFMKGGDTQVPTWKSPSTTPFGPHGFTGGGGGRMVVPWTNTVTGQTWNAPSTGYLPPSGDWQQTGKWEGRTPVKSLSGPVDSPNPFTSGWSSGQGDRRPPAVPLPIDTMERGGTPAVPMPTVTGAMPGMIPKDIMGRGRMPAIPLPRVSGESFRGPLAGFDPGNRRPIYDRNGRLIQQRPFLGDKQSHIPIPIMDYVGSQTAMNRGLDNWGGNLKGTFDQPGYGDPSSLDPWGQDWDYRDDDYDINVLDPGFGDYGPGPLYFT